MVSAHFWTHAYSAKTGGQSPGEQVRYLRREGEFDPVGYLQRTNQHTKDYSDFVVGDTQHLPAWAEGNPTRFFLASAQYERHNGYYARTIQFSLPRELTHAQHLALTHDFMAATMPNLPALWVKHDKQLPSGERHPHIHILFSTRQVDGIERDPRRTFARWNSDHPERGGCQKDPFWNHRRSPEQLRQAFADITNYHLEHAGATERVDPRALRRRDIQRDPIRWGNERPDESTRAKEQRQAQQAWERRKAYQEMGDILTVSREDCVAQVRHRTRTWVAEQATPQATLAQQQQEQQHKAQAYRGYQQQLEAQLHRLETVQERLSRGEHIPPHDLLRLVATAQEETSTHGYTMTLDERTQGYGR